MSDFGSDLCPGEPCSVSLDHNFYASDSEEQPVVPFNTLGIDPIIVGFRNYSHL